MMSISTIDRSSRALQQLDRLAAGARRQHLHPAPLEHAATARRCCGRRRRRPAPPCRPDPRRSGAAARACAASRAAGREVTRCRNSDGLVEQPLRRLDALDHHAAGQRAELGVLLRRQLAAGEDHDRHVARSSSWLIVSSTSKPDMSGSRRSSTTQSNGCSAMRRERRGAGVGDDDVEIVVAEQLRDAQLLGGVVLDHQQPLAPRPTRRSSSRRIASFSSSVVARLGQERERAARQAVLAILVERDDLHRDVPRLRILLQLAEHGPAEHVGQEDVERHRGRPVLARQRQRVGAARRDQHLEAAVVGEVDEHPRVVRIVLDDQQRRLAGLRRARDRRAPPRWSAPARGPAAGSAGRRASSAAPARAARARSARRSAAAGRA